MQADVWTQFNPRSLNRHSSGRAACIHLQTTLRHTYRVSIQIPLLDRAGRSHVYIPASTPTKKSDDNHDFALSSRDSSPCDYPDEDYRAKQMRYQPPRKLPKTDGREKDRRISDEEMFDIDENEDAPDLDRTAAHRGKQLRPSTTRSSPVQPGSSAHPGTPKAGSARRAYQTFELHALDHH